MARCKQACLCSFGLTKCWLRRQFLARARCKQACLCSFGLTKCWLCLQFLAMAKCKQACLCSFGLTKLFDNCHFPCPSKFHLGTLIFAIFVYFRNHHQSTNVLMLSDLSRYRHFFSGLSIGCHIFYSNNIDVDPKCHPERSRKFSSTIRAAIGHA